MPTISEALTIAIQHHQAGHWQAAEAIYRQIIAVEPDNAPAWHLLGLVAHHVGRHQIAVEYIGRAIGLNGTEAPFHNNLGGAYCALGRTAEAVACYRRAVELQPDYAEAHYNLGAVCKGQGKLDEAVVCYRRALELKPQFVEAHNNLAATLADQGKPDEAVACYRRVLELKPDDVEACFNLAVILNDQGKAAEALACYRRAIALRPGFAEAHYNLGAALKDRGQLEEAVACYRRAVALKPDFAEAHNNLGVALKAQGKLDEALACYRRAVELKPANASAHNNLGNVLASQKRFDEAAACYRRALELQPGFAEAHYTLGNLLKDQGKLDEAVACYRRALELKPEHTACLDSLVNTLQHQCCWEDLTALSRRVIEAVQRGAAGGMEYPVSPFNFFAQPAITTAEQQLQCARQWVDRKLKAISEHHPRPARHPLADRKSKITIGYLSADFHGHATAWLIAELIEKHDRDRFAVLGYSYGPDDGSPTRRRLVQAFDRFVDVKDASFIAAAQRIAADEVDILVDLKGHTKDARTEILALRPAPMQVNYLGYPGTMGAPFIDYLLVDDFVVPPDQQPFYAEKVVYLPGCYQANDSQRQIAPGTPSRAECGLPEEGFVFCCFNNSYKITAEVFGVWMELLKAIPGSVLWLLEGNRFAPANLRREAERRGVAAERLVFAPRKPLAEHLARHRLAQLFLDTFPVNAHTAASDALWAGCPLLTLAGATFASRVAGSLLRSLGLSELVTTSLADYQATALQWARNVDGLERLRARLAESRNTSPLFDGGRFARNVEQAYLTMLEMDS
jgi:predicted O-linked N-acetylglucosamine transferase (SPINDLY family)